MFCFIPYCSFYRFLDMLEHIRAEFEELMSAMHKKKIEVDKQRAEVDFLCAALRDRVSV